MGGSKDFAFTRSMTELSSVKVPTLTLGHPVGPVRLEPLDAFYSHFKLCSLHSAMHCREFSKFGNGSAQPKPKAAVTVIMSA